MPIQKDHTLISYQERLTCYLADNNIVFQPLKHHQAYTAQEIAAEQKVSGNQLAEVVMVMGDGQMAMLVMPATQRVNLRKLAGVLGCPDVRLANENQFSGLFPDCDPGAMPLRNLYNVSGLYRPVADPGPRDCLQCGHS